MARRGDPTATSAFGVGRRESHDATRFYARFRPPVVSADAEVRPAPVVDELFVGDARHMSQVADASVALVVTSPPYFAGKEYEAALGSGHVPATYLDYLEMLCAVFAECAVKLEPGGRIAVNVANLGRRPYRSLAADVISILQDRLGLLLRGEVVWWKARGAAGSCAWGSFRSPANPVLRDLTERVVIASKGRFDRAFSARERAARGLPAQASISCDEFLEATTDVWEIPAESATRVGHPAPFPVELPLRLIELFTYRGDVVLDPFVGSGTTAVAALRAGRHYLGYDTDEAYVAAARARVAGESPGTVIAERPDGHQARHVARSLLLECGFDDVVADRRLAGGVTADLAAHDRAGGIWLFDVSGAFTTTRTGLSRTDTATRAIGTAAVLRAVAPDARVVLLTTDAPAPGSAAELALRAVRPGVVFDVAELLGPDDASRLRRYAVGDAGPPATMGER
ncbi:MAG TPA: site-specific DNA-methyltransferase [Acidimicrobiales bacterium]|nr:site-specific DNA-methyltransferase [Acidimicrobiales bacterium]